MITIGVLGYGYWSPILVKNFAPLDCRIKRIVDRNTPKLEAARALYPEVIATKDPDDVFNDNEIDAVVVTLPADLHYDMAKKALLAGKHVLLEKPMTDSAETARELAQLAKARGLVLMVDHHFCTKTCANSKTRLRG